MKNLDDSEQRRVFSENLRARMDRVGMTQAELAQKLGLGQSTIAEWYHGRKYPRPKSLQMIADALGVYMSDLREPQNSTGQTKKAVAIPVLGSVPAGIPISAVQEILDWEEISEDMARRGEYFALRIRGTSMEPRFREGDVIIVRQQETVENGEIAVVMVNGEDATVKHFYRSDAGITLTGTNPSFPPLTYTPDQAESLPVRIIGKVVELRAKF